MAFLVATKEEFLNSGIEQFDFIMVTGDAYVDHPSFGSTIIARVLESHGFSVGIISQPKWDTLEDFTRYGEPRLGFLVTAGNIDSMVNHYSVSKNRRKKDYYSPNGEMGLRPDRATIVYGNKIREAYKDTNIILGGVEASLRRLSHYDYWDNKVRRSILLDSSADILVYGMGENQIVAIAEALDGGIPASEINFIDGTVYKTKHIDEVYDYILLPEFNKTKSEKKTYNESFKIQHQNSEYLISKRLVEPYGNVYVVQNQPTAPLTTQQFDQVYALPYERDFHPMYEEKGGIPAIEEVKFSIIANRGCFGSCSFCALTFHQGRIMSARSERSILAEAEKITWDKDFKGYIHDVGGPTANFRKPACDKQLKEGQGVCPNKKCMFPKPCAKLNVDHKEYLRILRKIRELPRVKKVFVRSGIRYDYMLADKDDTFFKELCEYHVSGQLKVAPEHISDKVLAKMGKPPREVYEQFTRKYQNINNRLGKEQYVVPYLMSSHPASDLDASIELALYLKSLGHTPEQVQDFYPTPGTLSTCIYHTGVDPFTNEEVYVPRAKQDKAMQRALMQYRLPQNYELVYKALKQAGRDDLIGFDEKCLIRPRNIQRKINEKYNDKNSNKNSNNKNSSDKNSSNKSNNNKNSSNGKSQGQSSKSGSKTGNKDNNSNNNNKSYGNKGKSQASKSQGGKSKNSQNFDTKSNNSQSRKGKTIRSVHKKKGK